MLFFDCCRDAGGLCTTWNWAEQSDKVVIAFSSVSKIYQNNYKAKSSRLFGVVFVSTCARIKMIFMMIARIQNILRD